MPESAVVTPAGARSRKADPSPPVLELRGATAHAPDGTVLLDDVSFAVAPGRVVAIVGPTGAGKTSLARALTGSLALSSGSMRVEGRIAFVPQHDALHAGLSLHEALRYAAELRLPDLNRAERAARIDAVVAELGLAQHLPTAVGDLSAGQRKRASIAAQLLGNPDVLVLDEPTANLDPGYERIVLTTLRTLADHGRSIVIVTHSPESLHACDEALFLAAGGVVAFFGAPRAAFKHFGTSDTADLFLALDTQAVTRWHAPLRAVDASPSFGAKLGAAPRNAPKLGGRQVGMLVRRQVNLWRNDRRHLGLLALQAPLIGGLLWMVLPANALAPRPDGSFGSKAALVLMFLVLSTTWLGAANSIREIVKERSILRWETAAGLHPRAYVVSKIASLGALTMLQAAVVAFLATIRQNAPADGVVFGSTRVELIAISALAGFAACALGLLLSASAKSPDRALALLPMTLVVQLVLAGEWAASAQLPLLRQARAVVSTRWASEAMVGSLRGDAAQFWAAVLALLGVAAGLGLATAALVTRATRHAGAPRRHTLPQASLGGLIGVGSAAAVALSVTAGGVGVVAIAHYGGGTNDAPALAAPAPARTKPTAAAPATTTPAPVAEVAAPPVTTPPVTTPAVRTAAPAATGIVAGLVDTVTDVTLPPVTVPPVLAPVTTPTTAPPTTTPTTTPLGGLLKLLKIFTPRTAR